MTADTTVLPGQDVEVSPGQDRTEPTETVAVAVAAAVPAGVYVGGTPGRDRVVRGTVSLEVVARTHLQAATIGHLPHGGTVTLTFDDGPNPPYTGQVLSLLAAHRVAATFCLVGRQVQRYPAVVGQILAGGHDLCDHTMDHDLRLATRPPEQIRADIADGKAAITAASGGVAPLLFRAPGGAWSPQMIAEARAQGMRDLHWSVDPRDWSRPGTDAIVASVLSQLRPGGVILMHDGGGDRSQSVAALGRLLDLLPSLGYSFVRV